MKIRSLLLVLAISVLTIVPMMDAHAADPAIKFLNPSGYSPRMMISDKPDRDSSVHLVAWVQAVPSSPLVEFEIQPTVGNSITLDTTRVGSDTWEAFVSISELTDGQNYTLRAILYSNSQEVASTEQTVEVNRSDVPPPPAADTVEISYPSNGAQVGFSNFPGRAAAGLLDVTASEGTDQVRVMYTTSAPGTAPAWVGCGSGAVGSSLSLTIRCTLAEGTPYQQVTAVAAIANNTPPPSSPNTLADATGDSHRVFPYLQKPTSVSITPESVRVDVGRCQLFEARSLDQSLRPMPGANVDIHVVGPNDQIRFGTIRRSTDPTATQLTSPFQAPDKSHVSTQAAIDCGNGETLNTQGDHNIPGANDPQHIESTVGTNDEGRFLFALYSSATGGSNVTAWIDDDDDDTLDALETTGGARIGWGQDVPEPTTEIFMDPRTSAGTSGDCQQVIIAAKRGGNPLPGVNVDIHASGPDATVAFCAPPGSSFGRTPDLNHVGNDDETTRHLEGETSSSGQFVFGVMSGSSGTTSLLAWIDVTDDDVLASGEQSITGSVQWDISGARTISIQSNRSVVTKGRNVRIFGAIDGAAACESGHVVKLKAKPLNRGRFRLVSSTLTATDGSYSFVVRVTASKRYKAIAPAADPCEFARSGTITVRAR